MSNTDARITLPTLNRPTTLPHVGIEKADAGVLAGGAGGGMLAGLYLQLGLLTLPAIVAGLGAGLIILLASPSHMTGTAYLQVLVQSLRTASHVSNTDPDSTATDADSGLLSRFRTTRTTRTRTHVRRYHPNRGIIERDDGRFAAALCLEPQGMDFAEADDWTQLTNTLSTLANDSLGFPIQVYVTTRSFPMEDYLGSLEERLQDDFESEQRLQTILENYIETRRADLEETTTAPPSVYIIVEVSDDEVLDETAGETTGLARLAQVPLIGIPFSLFVRGRNGIDDRERLDRVTKALERRLSVIESDWVAPVEGADSERLSLAEWLPLIEEFWTGTRPAASDPNMVRSAPVVTALTGDAPPGAADPPAPGDPRDAPESAETETIAESRSENGPSAAESDPESIPSVAEIQQRQLAPDGIEESFETVQTGEDHCQVMYVDSWPDTIELGALRRVFRRSDIEYDLSIHLQPIDRSTALDQAETRYRSLRGDAEVDGDDLAAREKLSDADETALFRRQVKEGQSPFRVSVYVVARAPDEETLQEASRELRSRFRDPPADTTLKTVTGEQLRALESASPVGRDVLSDQGASDTSEVMLGRGVGALLASIQDSGIVDPGGMELGEHAYNGKPVIVDPFDTGVNYNWTVVGDSGSGKTYFAAQTATRALLQDSDTKLVFIDPMQAFEGVARALGADTIRVGGQQSLNPLEIRPPADDTSEIAVDPLRQKIQDVLSLFDNFAHQQGIEGGLGEARSLLSTALSETYERAGITHDVSTHDRESPTIRDLLDVLQHMADSPEEYILRTEQETENVSRYATRLLSLLRPFVDGEYSHLSEQSSLEFGDSDVIYMDMSEEEGRTGGGGGLSMQLVFSRAYEYAKESAERVIIVIDEARFFMRHSTNLDFLGQRVRHSRHWDTSIRFYTQNINDFYDHAEAESIINNSAVTVLHNVAEIDEWQNTFDLNDREVEYVRSAATGAEGYSEALVDINGRRLPLQIFATPLEDELIDFDPSTDTLSSVPGLGGASHDGQEPTGPDPEGDHTGPEQSPAGQATPIEWVRANADETLVRVWGELRESHQEHADLLTGPELQTVLETIRDSGEPPAAILATALETKIDSVVASDLGEHLERQFGAAEGASKESPATLTDVDPETLSEPPEPESWRDGHTGSRDGIDPTEPPAPETVEEIEARWDDRLETLAEEAADVDDVEVEARAQPDDPAPGSNVPSHSDPNRISMDDLRDADRDWSNRLSNSLSADDPDSDSEPPRGDSTGTGSDRHSGDQWPPSRGENGHRRIDVEGSDWQSEPNRNWPDYPDRDHESNSHSDESSYDDRDWPVDGGESDDA